MPEPPRHGEGDRPQAGGGVFATTAATLRLARRERRSGNLPEVVLWRALRGRPGDFRFRRQHPIRHYVLDFACLSARLGIEVDGEVHGRGDRPARDTRRDSEMAALGFETLRVRAQDVLTEPQAVLDLIVAACRRRSPLHHPRRGEDGPPPRSGEV